MIAMLLLLEIKIIMLILQSELQKLIIILINIFYSNIN